MPEITVQQAPQSHVFRNIMIIIIIALLIWQYLLPSFIVIKTPSQYIEDYFFKEDSSSNWRIFLIDQTTGIREEFLGYQYYERTMTQYHTYQIGIASNIPCYLTANYKIDLRVNYWNVSIGDWSIGGLFIINIPGYEPLYKHEWIISQNTVFLNYETTFTLHFYLLDIHGISMTAQGSQYHEQVLRLNDYLNSAP